MILVVFSNLYDSMKIKSKQIRKGIKKRSGTENNRGDGKGERGRIKWVKDKKQVRTDKTRFTDRELTRIMESDEVV